MPKKAQHRVLSQLTLCAGAALAVVLAACSSDLASPAARAPQTRAPQLLSAGGRLISNSVKYRDTSKPNATGRSGSARMEGSAVRGANGITTLTLVAGGVNDTRLGRGEIAKAQIKVFGADGSQLFVLNQKFSGAGQQVVLLNDVPAGATIQVQANVRGVDRNRTDVVTLTLAVGLAPALAVDADVPDQGQVGQPVIITGTVSETNGDVGTRADCQLWVDGRLQDEASSIVWGMPGSVVKAGLAHEILPLDAIGRTLKSFIAGSSR